MDIEFTLNGKSQVLQADESMPLLWALRDRLQLTGTKFGCGMAQCGACTVHLDGTAIRSCVTPVAVVQGRSVTTIEGLESGVAQAVQQSWDELAVVQCGYCQSGQIMSAVALLEINPNPSDEQIDQSMSGNICRCSTYVRIRAAIKDAAGKLAKG
ncbi:2Fe-2S iron-sulfur cluster binding domain-containing protein [Pseudomaricurvus sp. HS19]|nr:2Fe-2S iron-sulfur cluster binding domain-containing protein [Pseudomaricurvus sp. HS19]